MNTQALDYVVLAGNQVYYVVHASNRKVCVAIFANRYEAYADAERRSADSFVDHMEAQS